MRKLLIVLLAMTMQASPAMAWERVGDVFKLDKEDIAMCAKGAGCRVVHDDVVDFQIAQVRREAYLAGYGHGLKAGRADVCKGPST